LNLIDVLKYRNLILVRGAAESLALSLTTPITRGPRGLDKLADASTNTNSDVVADDAAMAEERAGTPADVAVADGAELAFDRESDSRATEEA